MLYRDKNLCSTHLSDRRLTHIIPPLYMHRKNRTGQETEDKFDVDYIIMSQYRQQARTAIKTGCMHVVNMTQGSLNSSI